MSDKSPNNNTLDVPFTSSNADRTSNSNWDDDDDDKFFDPIDFTESESRSVSVFRDTDTNIKNSISKDTDSVQSSTTNIIVSPSSSVLPPESTTQESEANQPYSSKLSPPRKSISVNDNDSLSSGQSNFDGDSKSLSALIERDDPVDIDVRRNLIVNVESGALMSIEDFPNDGLTTFENLRKEKQAQPDEAEVQRKKENLGFFPRLFHRSALSEAPESNSVKVKVHRKNEQMLSDLRHVQTMSEHNGPVWTMKWSLCGCFLATAGQDAIIRIWVVIGSEAHEKWMLEKKQAAEESEEKKISDANATTISDDDVSDDILDPIPYRAYSAHKLDIIDLAWSKSSFLLSASMDYSVRLWHVSKMRCLSMFQHTDFVTSVSFHPKESRLFLSGSFDKKLRMWNILEHQVVDWTQTPTMITSATFNPSGTLTAAGLYSGQCVLYTAEGLKYFTQIDCRNRHGKHRKGRKVTGVQFSSDGKQLLVTTNDSRVRLYDMDDYSMRMKYKGLENEQLQTRARFSEDDEDIICGSDDACVFTWKTHKDYGHSLRNSSLLRNKNDRNDSYEHFKSHGGIVTAALFAPASTRKMASLRRPNEDPIRQMIISAGYDGKIKLFQNRCEPRIPRS